MTCSYGVILTVIFNNGYQNHIAIHTISNSSLLIEVKTAGESKLIHNNNLY